MNLTANNILELIQRIYANGTVQGADGTAYSIEPASVTPARGRFIAEIVRVERALLTLEIGLAWGLA
jgi:hypothetical protein